MIEIKGEYVMRHRIPTLYTIIKIKLKGGTRLQTPLPPPQVPKPKHIYVSRCNEQMSIKKKKTSFWTIG